jgi:hypothetical protein
MDKAVSLQQCLEGSEYIFFDGERVARKDFPGNAVCLLFFRSPKNCLGQAQNSATMTHTQASVSAGRSDSFVLCVVPLEDRQPTVDIVRNQSRFAPSIGHRLRQKVDEVLAIRNLQDLTAQPTDGVQVVVEQGEFRYRVSESVWTAELSFQDFKLFLLRFVEKAAVVGGPE